MKIGEDTAIKIDLKTIVAIIMITSTFVGMYYTLQADIEVAKNEPKAAIERLEYDLKEEWNEQMIMSLKERIEMLEEGQDLLREEIKITSSMLQDGTEADDKFAELNAQLEALKKRKPKVIVREIKVDKKGRKL
jgi:predicted Mrr-cat superfamily restriction endonuclease|tara:strand:+ start:210 stop:611 length:402 start_codon:yes stop_codon:yes gene_type:complete